MTEAPQPPSAPEAAAGNPEVPPAGGPAESRLVRFRRRLVREIPWIVLMLALYWALSDRQAPEAEVGKPAPAMTGAWLAGGSPYVAPSDGKQTLYVFWAPWCGVCKTEFKLFGDLQESLGDGVRVVGVGLAGSRSEMQAFVSENPTDFPSIMGDSTVPRRWGLRAYPTLYLVDGDGILKKTWVGITTPWSIRWAL